MRTTLNTETQDAVRQQLQPMVVELADLSLMGKQLHWNVVGPNFRPLHHQLDEFVDAWRQWTDQVAERLTTIGVPADGKSATIARDTSLDPVPDGWVEDRTVIELLSDRIEAVAKRARRAMEELDKTDLASQDVLIQIVSGLEEQLWMLSAQE